MCVLFVTHSWSYSKFSLLITCWSTYREILVVINYPRVILQHFDFFRSIVLVCKKKRISFQNKKRREDKNITITHGLMTMNVFHNLFNPSNRKFERCYVVFETTKYFSYGTNSKLLILYKSPMSQVWWITSIKAWSAMSYGCLHLVLNPIRKSNQKNDRWYYKCRKMRLPVLLIYKMTDYWQPTVHLLVIRATHICTSIFVQIY